MTKDEALDLALAALECFDYPAHDDDVNKIQAAITAIKQARALDKKAENARELGLDYEPVLKDNSNYRYDPPVAEPVQSCYCPNCEAMGKELVALKAQPAPVQDIEHCIWARNGNTPCPHTTPPAAPVQDLPFGVGGGLVAIKTLLSRDPCVHANTAIEMIDAILKEHPAAQPAPVQPVPWSQALESVWAEPDDTPPAAQPAVPDAIIEAGESPEFRDGWNQCRETMLQMLKAKNT
jgi:hypothetical protein